MVSREPPESTTMRQLAVISRNVFVLLVTLVAIAPASLAAQRIEPTRLARPAASRTRDVTAPALVHRVATPAAEKATASWKAFQFLVATTGAVVGGSIGYRMAHDPATDRVKGDEGYNQRANVGFAAGSAAGAALAGYAVGRLDGSHGSLAMTTLGAALPALPMAAASDDPYSFLLAVLLCVPGEGLGATIGYQSSREQ